jgi:hypothetical protein
MSEIGRTQLNFARAARFRPAVDVNSFKNIKPADFIRRMSGGRNLLLEGRTIDGLSRANYGELSSLMNGHTREVKEMKAARVIAASRLFVEGLDIGASDLTPIVNKMATLMIHGGNTYKDVCRISDLCRLVGERMNLPRRWVDDLSLAAFLHDIGKSGGKDVPESTEIASAKIFAVMAKFDWVDTLNNFVHKFLRKDGPDSILGALAHLSLDNAHFKFDTGRNGDPFGKFIKLHTYLGDESVEGRIPEKAREIMGFHHVFQGVVGTDRALLAYECGVNGQHGMNRDKAEKAIKSAVRGMMENENLMKAVMILTYIDQIDAHRFRTEEQDHEGARSATFAGVSKNNRYLRKSILGEVESIFTRLVDERHPLLVEHGFVDADAPIHTRPRRKQAQGPSLAV